MREDGDSLDAATTSDAETAGDDKEGAAVPAKDPVRIGQGDRYLLGRALGRGGMGEVIAAHDEQIGREVAIKRMLRTKGSDRAMARFFREASIQGRLDHPSIVPVHEIGVDAEGRPFFVMKRLAGESMVHMIEKNEPRNRLLRAFADVCLTVELAHTRGVVHRDLKPDNILLGEFGEVYVIDWGVAKIQQDPDDEAPEFTRVEAAELHTAMGAAIGTPGYMAPEQVRGARDLDGRADVYSLGCILFEILTGTMMHPKGEAGLLSALEGTTERPSQRAIARDIPPELDALVLHATAPVRESRLRTARELGERVQRYLDGDRDLGLRRTLATEHLQQARDAFQLGDIDSRSIAMREAARSLALDPTLAGAAELLTRLMLEPPRETPPEVERQLSIDRLQEIHRHSGTGIRGYIGYLSLAPLLVATGEQRLYALALVAIVGLNCAILATKATFDTLAKRAVALAAANALLVGLLGRMFSPFLVAPAIATVTASALVFGPSYQRRASVVALAALMASALFVPWIAELAGAFGRTTTLTSDGIGFTGVALQISDGPKIAALVLTAIAAISAAAGMSFRMCTADRAVRRKLHLQAWQLRQLVPEPAARAATSS